MRSNLLWNKGGIASSQPCQQKQGRPTLLAMTLKGISMARFMRLEVVNTLLAGGLVPLFYNGEIDTASS